MNGPACGSATVPLKRVAPRYFPHSRLHPVFVSVHLTFLPVSSFKLLCFLLSSRVDISPFNLTIFPDLNNLTDVLRLSKEPVVTKDGHGGRGGFPENKSFYGIFVFLIACDLISVEENLALQFIIPPVRSSSRTRFVVIRSSQLC